MHVGFITVTLQHGDHQHVSESHVAIFKVVTARIQIYL